MHASLTGKDADLATTSLCTVALALALVISIQYM